MNFFFILSIILKKMAAFNIMHCAMPFKGSDVPIHKVDFFGVMGSSSSIGFNVPPNTL